MTDEIDHREILARRIGDDVVAAMNALVAMPDDLGVGAHHTHEFKTVDGHCFTITIEYDGFEGAAQLAAMGEG